MGKKRFSGMAGWREDGLIAGISSRRALKELFASGKNCGDQLAFVPFLKDCDALLAAVDAQLTNSEGLKLLRAGHGWLEVGWRLGFPLACPHNVIGR
jgi:hypothetical protein